MSDELPPLGSLASRALDAERRRADVDRAMEERLLARVVASVAVGAAATAAASTAAASTAATSTGAAAAQGLTIKALPWIVVAFVAGGGAGAALHAAVATPPPLATPQASAVATGVAPPMTVPTAAVSDGLPATPVASLPSAPLAPSVSGQVAVTAPRPSSSAVPSASAANDVDLAAERALVDRARAAISRGQGRDALDALDAHASRYPRGRLSEERDALAVDALARVGRIDDARARASRFHASYPNSVFAGVVDAATAPR